jgi:hypothetical protein
MKARTYSVVAVVVETIYGDSRRKLEGRFCGLLAGLRALLGA